MLTFRYLVIFREEQLEKDTLYLNIYNEQGITKNLVLSSSRPVKEVTKACACVPRTGIPNNFPASTFEVPSKPPKNDCCILLLFSCFDCLTWP